jgi:hypothetical protein
MFLKVPEIIEVLDILFILLPEVLEANPEGLGSIFQSINLKELLLQLITDVLVQLNNVIEHVVP